jgi:hypothetical protein
VHPRNPGLPFSADDVLTRHKAEQSVFAKIIRSRRGNGARASGAHVEALRRLTFLIADVTGDYAESDKRYCDGGRALTRGDRHRHADFFGPGPLSVGVDSSAASFRKTPHPFQGQLVSNHGHRGGLRLFDVPMVSFRLCGLALNFGAREVFPRS